MKHFLLSLILAMLALLAEAQQEDFDAFRRGTLAGFNSYRSGVKQDYESYRQKINADYAEFMRQVWREYHAFKGDPVPEDDVKPIPPLPYEDRKKEEPPVIDQEIPIEPIITPVPTPQPQPRPVEPVEDKPILAPSYFAATYCGTNVRVRLSPKERFRLASLKETNVADAWNALSTVAYGNLLYDCLQWRDRLHLCDWAYLNMLSTICEEYFGGNSSEATLLLAWLYCQSGYKMRIAANETHLEMLFASEHKIYNQPYYKLGGQRFYPFHHGKGGALRIFDHAFEGEQPMSLLVNEDQLLAFDATKERTIASRDYPYFSVRVQVNRNNLSFYDSYPTSELNDNPMTRWAMYANEPLTKEVRQHFYPSLIQYLSGKSQPDAANILLNWVQTGFEYEYDDKVWGGDRAFFAEETLYYPYCDCEDRSILFSKLIRDLLDLDVLLVYYPGHLATAVGFTDDVKGDYILYQGKRYVVCDPTYIGAPVGRTMPKMDNTKARVILLQ